MAIVTVSGSFHRHLDSIERVVHEFWEMGDTVLSPEDPRVVDAVGPFLFVASDRHRAVRLVQDRHLAAISRSDFVWLECPDGYVGQSAALEIGFAIGQAVPVFSTHAPLDLTMQEYVNVVSSPHDAKSLSVTPADRRSSTLSLLVSPEEVVEEAGQDLMRLEGLLTGSIRYHNDERLGHEVYRLSGRVADAVKLIPRRLS